MKLSTPLLTLAASSPLALSSISAQSISMKAPRHLQDSITCLLSGTDPAVCCASAAPTDQLCSLFNCIDMNTLLLNEDDVNCSCSSVVTFCDSFAVFLAGMDPNISGLCDSVGSCCDANLSNAEFNTCFSESGADVGALSGIAGGDATGGGADGTNDVTFPGMDFSDFGINSTDSDSYTDLFGGFLGDASQSSTSSASPTTSPISTQVTPVENEGEQASDSDPDESGAIQIGSAYAFVAATIIMILV